MHVLCSHEKLIWGQLDLPLLGITRDWEGDRIDPPPGWSLVMDSERLWFVASHSRPAKLHPQSRPGRFQAGLWQFDVAELFLGDPVSGHYLEFNLAPNGAWWSCGFTAARERRQPDDREPAGVATFAELAPDGTWVAAISLPLGLLRQEIGFGTSTTGNVTFILGHPKPRYLSAADLACGDGGPDFHRPECFPPLTFHDE